MDDLEETTKSAFIICPVRGLTKEEKKFIEDYVADLERKGYEVHWPPRDTNQDDAIGYNICSQNRDGIKTKKEVHIYWNKSSEGSKFDFGMLFMALLYEAKKVVIMNPHDVKRTPHKSFENVLLELAERYQR